MPDVQRMTWNDLHDALLRRATRDAARAEMTRRRLLKKAGRKSDLTSAAELVPRTLRLMDESLAADWWPPL